MNIFIKKLLMFFILSNISHSVFYADSIEIKLTYRPDTKIEGLEGRQGVGRVALEGFFRDKAQNVLYQAKMTDRVFEEKNTTFKVTITALFKEQVDFFTDLKLGIQCNHEPNQLITCTQKNYTSVYKLSLQNHRLELNFDEQQGELDTIIDEVELLQNYRKDNFIFYKWQTEHPSDPNSSFRWYILPYDIVNDNGYII